MQFNTKKCNIITFANRQTPLVKLYELNGIALKHVELATYLGILLSKSLDFKHHIREAVSKANSKLGFLKRNLKNCPAHMRNIAYLSFVRSGLEYCSTIWDPYDDVDIDAVEMVQHRAVRWIHGYGPRERCSVTKLRTQLKLDTLEHRREQARLTLMFKVTKGLIAVTEDDLNLKLQDTRTRKKKLERSAKTFKSLPGRLDRRKFSTVNRTIAPWNKLPAAVAEMPDSVDTFKSRLSALRP